MWGLLVALCCGVAHAHDRTLCKRKRSTSDTTSWWSSTSTTEDNSFTFTTTPTLSVQASPATEGGIDPTTVPIVDEDLIFMAQATRAQLQADEAHTVATGRGVVVAVLDGGFNLNHPDIASNLDLGYDAIDDDLDPHDTGNGIDDDADGIVDRGVGHGTFVAGMVLLAAPEATIVPIRVRDDEGYGSNAETLRGLEYARRIGADVINLSISNAAADEDEILDLVVAIVSAGVPVIVSAGNDATLISAKALALSEFTLAVGAVDADDIIAEFSNFALFDPMIYAPGVDLYGPIGTPEDDSRGTWSGTSFSAGLVSGAAALVHCVRPGCSPQQVYDHLRTSVDWARNAWYWPLSSGRVNLKKVVMQ